MHAIVKGPRASLVAKAYNLSGDTYSSYADGGASELFRFAGKHAYADRCVWACLSARLSELRLSGATALRVLDAGCGPGIWVRRLVVRAKELGFTDIAARAIDLSPTQIQQARARYRDLAALSGVSVEFSVADLTSPLPDADGIFDLTLCLYSVLSHIPVAVLPSVAKELTRVTRGYFVTTVRSLGSMPSGIVAAIEDVRRLRHDQRRNWCEIELTDGRAAAFDFHLFSSSELRSLFESGLEVTTLQGLDFFHSRFSADSRWNPTNLDVPQTLRRRLAALEKLFSANPEFNDHANHLLLVGRPLAKVAPKPCQLTEQRPTPSLRSMNGARRHQ
jgi:SAM-dependent methyltransferase